MGIWKGRASWNFAFLIASKAWNVCQGIRDEAHCNSLNFVEALSWLREGRKRKINKKNKNKEKKNKKKRGKKENTREGDEKLE